MISYERATLSAFNWQTLYVDEAHRLKNKQSKVSLNGFIIAYYVPKFHHTLGIE